MPISYISLGPISKINFLFACFFAWFSSQDFFKYEIKEVDKIFYTNTAAQCTHGPSDVIWRNEDTPVPNYSLLYRMKDA